MMKHAGIAGVFPDSAHSWGQSILKLSDDPGTGFELLGTYTPFNYCQTAAHDIDLGSSGTVVIDLDPHKTSTPHLLALGGAKQGNVYLLDRAQMPGGVIKRHPCSEDSSSDLSLLAPESQPQFGKRGPVNVFGPYTDVNAMFDQARSRTTLAYFHAASGQDYIYVTGSSKSGKDYSVSTPPGLARIRIVTSPGQPAYLQVDQLEQWQTFENPGSPIVTSSGGKNGIVWVLDMNAPRLASLYGTHAPKPILYAFDALSLRLLWKSALGVLSPGGKYNEPTVVNGTVFVGTDRVQAFGIRKGSRSEELAAPTDLGRPVVSPPPGPSASAVSPRDTKAVQMGKVLYEQRCAMCHSAKDLGAPPEDEIAQLPHGQIVDVLEIGIMQNMAMGLGQEDIQALATFLNSTATTP